MSDINIHKALSTVEQKAIKRADLDPMVNHLAEYTLRQSNIFGLSNLIFRAGQPGKTPSGGWGYVLYGTNDIYRRPEPNPLDYRVSWRSGEIPVHEIEYGSLYMVESKVTDYWGRNMLDMIHPKKWFSFHMAALRSSLTLYWTYLIWKVFASEEKIKKEWAVKKWSMKYIEPSNGATDGFNFMNSMGYGQINLYPVINKQKITENDLKKKLEDINKALFSETRKYEIDTSKDEFVKTKFKQDQFTQEQRKALAYWFGAEQFIREAIELGYLENKYKHKNTEFEGFQIPITAGNMFVIASTDLLYELKKMMTLIHPTQGSLELNSIGGVKIYWTPLRDKYDMLFAHDELFKIWVIPSTRHYRILPYVNQNGEETTDYVYYLGHTININDVFSSVWIKAK